jgi:sterol desaturase/sphingolipid hydroxylase (fatty acid hydroxylase superfamily)
MLRLARGVRVPPHQASQPLRGSPVLFTNNYIEAYVSRVKPWQVVAIWLPTAAYFAAQSMRAPLPWSRQVGLFFLGLLAWTLFEYAYHRFVEHFPPQNVWQAKLTFVLHGVHHQYPWDPDRLVMPPVVSIPLGAGLYYVTRAILGIPALYPFFTAMILFYLFYDMQHYAMHQRHPRTAFGRSLRAYHLLHHFKTPTLRYGVSCPVWDYVFGTLPTPGKARARSA